VGRKVLKSERSEFQGMMKKMKEKEKQVGGRSQSDVNRREEKRSFMMAKWEKAEH
jgi:hypothetical protein